MLPDRLIELRKIDELTRLPAWLSSRDEVWLRPLVDEMEAIAGGTTAAADARIKTLAEQLSRDHGVGMRRVEAVWHVERRRWRKVVDSPIAPAEVRSTVFDHAARHGRREGMKRASELLGIDPLTIEKVLFADREDERIMLPPDPAATPAELVGAYNLALAEAVMARATRIVVSIRSDLRHVVSYARLLGLMFTVTERGDGITEIELSGPLALFHETRKYGYALARFFPALSSTVGWSAVADVQLGRDAFAVPLSPSDPLPRTHALPRSFDSAVEKRLAADLRRLAPERGWRVERESALVSTGVGREVFYPDFTLVGASGGRVLVEVVGFWTPEYLARKQRALAAVREPIVICVDARRVGDLGAALGRAAGATDAATEGAATEGAATEGAAGGHAVVVTYRGRVDAGALLAAAERAALASRVEDAATAPASASEGQGPLRAHGDDVRTLGARREEGVRSDT